MSLNVKPEDLRSFGDMLGDAAKEAKEARDGMAENFADASTEVAGVGAYPLELLSYCNIGDNVDSFYSSAAGALNETKDVLKELAKAYEDDDADNADEIAAAYWDDELAENGDPAEEKGIATGSENVDVQENAQKFKYVGYGTPRSLAEYAKHGATWDPLQTIDIPEFKEYPDAVEWAATWGMDTTFVASLFVGDWDKASAADSSLGSLSRLNGWIASSVIEGKDRLVDSWEGEAAESCQKYTKWMADNIGGCENTLAELGEAMSEYVESIDNLASGVAEYLGGPVGFIWEADWARALDCPKGPLQGPAIPTPALSDGLGGIDKAKFTEYLKTNPYDFEGKNFSSWATKANMYIAAAYAGMLEGLLTQFEMLLLTAYDYVSYAEAMESAVKAANTDLEQGAERLNAFRGW